MSTDSPTIPSYSLKPKHFLFGIFGLLAVVVFVLYDLPFVTTDAGQHFARTKWWLVPHGIAGLAALVLAPLQFSNRLRAKHLQVHRIMGRIYVGSVFIAAPIAVPIAVLQGPPVLIMASVVQSGGWLVTTAIALYCIRAGKVAQHREWMVRSYPFAMIFVVARAIFLIPAVNHLGELGIVSDVWTCNIAAYFIPTLIISWNSIFGGTQTRHRAVAKVVGAS
jgi:uncharacterized membrane protein